MSPSRNSSSVLIAMVRLNLHGLATLKVDFPLTLGLVPALPPRDFNLAIPAEESLQPIWISTYLICFSL